MLKEIKEFPFVAGILLIFAAAGLAGCGDATDQNPSHGMGGAPVQGGGGAPVQGGGGAPVQGSGGAPIEVRRDTILAKLDHRQGQHKVLRLYRVQESPLQLQPLRNLSRIITTATTSIDAAPSTTAATPATSADASVVDTTIFDTEVDVVKIAGGRIAYIRNREQQSSSLHILDDSGRELYIIRSPQISDVIVSSDVIAYKVKDCNFVIIQNRNYQWHFLNAAGGEFRVDGIGVYEGADASHAEDDFLNARPQNVWLTRQLIIYESNDAIHFRGLDGRPVRGLGFESIGPESDFRIVDTTITDTLMAYVAATNLGLTLHVKNLALPGAPEVLRRRIAFLLNLSELQDWNYKSLYTITNHVIAVKGVVTDDVQGRVVHEAERDARTHFFDESGRPLTELPEGIMEFEVRFGGHYYVYASRVASSPVVATDPTEIINYNVLDLQTMQSRTDFQVDGFIPSWMMSRDRSHMSTGNWSLNSDVAVLYELIGNQNAGTGGIDFTDSNVRLIHLGTGERLLLDEIHAELESFLNNVFYVLSQ